MVTLNVFTLKSIKNIINYQWYRIIKYNFERIPVKVFKNNFSEYCWKIQWMCSTKILGLYFEG